MGASSLTLGYQTDELWPNIWGGACKQVVGQVADLADLQQILNCAKNRMNNNEQQNMTVRSYYLCRINVMHCNPSHFQDDRYCSHFLEGTLLDFGAVLMPVNNMSDKYTRCSTVLYL